MIFPTSFSFNKDLASPSLREAKKGDGKSASRLCLQKVFLAHQRHRLMPSLRTLPRKKERERAKKKKKKKKSKKAQQFLFESTI